MPFAIMTVLFLLQLCLLLPMDVHVAARRGGFGNLMPAEQAELASPAPAAAAAATAAAASGPCEVHGVLHKLTAAEMAALAGMEHEYWCVAVMSYC
jgi:hypothetical protein